MVTKVFLVNSLIISKLRLRIVTNTNYILLSNITRTILIILYLKVQNYAKLL